MVCKAVSVKSQTAVEGLNIAEDVTQVITHLDFVCGRYELGCFCSI